MTAHSARTKILVLLGLTFFGLSTSHGAEGEPILQLHGGGPANLVSSLTFSEDGQTLFGGGWDKVVWVWRKTDPGYFELDTAATLRIPIGPGWQGSINSIALSNDGKWLAVGGMGVFEGSSGFYDYGKMLPVSAMSDKMLRQQGVIHLFNLETRESFRLKEHLGEIVSLKFAEGNGPNVLISAAREFDRGSGVRKSRVLIWNADTQERIGRERTFVEPASRIGLASRRLSSRVDDLRIAIAMYNQTSEGKIRFWDVLRNRVRTSAEYASTVIRRNNHFLTGSITEPFSVRFWNDSANGLPNSRYRFTSKGDAGFLPFSICKLSSKLIAVGGVTTKQTAELRLISLNASNQGRQLATAKLWNLDPNTAAAVPELTATRNGKTIAVAGSPENQILMMETEQLLKAKPQPFQKLKLDVKRYASTKFAKNGDKRGVFLFDTENAKQVFSFETNELSDNTENWNDDSADTDNVSLKPINSPKSATDDIIVQAKSTGIDTRIKIPSGHQPTAATGFKGNDQTPTMLAIATQTKGQPLLQLFHGKTGDCIRQLTGHTDRIRALSFSGDGKMLVSTASDQRICVWDLTDLDKIIGRHGTVPGLLVKEQGDNQMSVVQAGAANGQLTKGDTILGAIENGSLKTWSSAGDFYETFWKAKPNQKVTLRRSRNGTVANVAIDVKQGIDERKPLFSLLVKPNGVGENLSWLAWSPLGLFESSDRKIEQLVGWHFNPEGDTPSVFAPLQQYRNEYFRPYLMKALLDAPNKAPARPQPLPPSLGWSIEGASHDFAGIADRVLMQKDAKVSLNISPDFPHDLIDSVSITIDGKPLPNISSENGFQWQVQLADQIIDRSKRKLQATVVTREQQPRTFNKDITIRFQPAAPTILANLLASYHSDENEFPFAASVSPGAPGHPFVVELIDGTGRVVWKREATQHLQVRHNLSLDEGANNFRLTARNADASRTSFDEIANYPFVVHREKQMTAPPEIFVTDIRATDVFGHKLLLPLDESADALVIESSEITLVGTVESTAEISTVKVMRDEKSSSLADFQGGKKQLAIEHTVKLTPGRQELRIDATANGTTSTWRRTIEFRPAMPEVVLQPPKQGTIITQELAGDEYEVIATFEKSPKHSEFDVQLIANDKQLPVVVDRETLDNTTILKAKVPIEIGENEIRMAISNDWQKRVTDPMIFEYAPKPTISKVTSEIDGAFSKVHIEGDLPGPRIRGIRVDKQEVAEADFELKQQNGQFELDLGFIPRTAKRGELLPETGPPIPIELQPVPEVAAAPTPLVSILGPDLVTITGSDEFAVRYSIESASKVDAIEFRNNDELVSYDVPNRHMSDFSGVFVYQGEIPVRLVQSINEIEVRARSKDGFGTATVFANRLQRPVSIIVDGFSYGENDPIELAPKARIGGRLSFDAPSETAEVWLHGRVKWANPNDRRLKINRYSIHVWVNGFQQLPVALTPFDGKSLTRRFRSRVLLANQNNSLKVSLPQITEADSIMQNFSVACQQPERNRRLHLLVISTEQTSENSHQLVDSAIRALDGTPMLRTKDREHVRFSAPSFDEGIVYGPLTSKQVTRQFVISEIYGIKDKIEELNHESPANDVIVIYYQGGEVVNRPEGFYLATISGESSGNAQMNPAVLQNSVDSETLNRLFELSQGAYVLLLDVKRHEQQVADRSSWPNDSMSAMLRYAWLRGSTSPESASLIHGLGMTVPKSPRLQDLQRGLRDNFNDLTRAFPDSMDFDDHVPNSLKNLTIGGSE